MKKSVLPILVSIAAYPDTAYVMNLDWEKPHSVVVELPGGKSESLELAPLEIRILPLPTGQ